MKKKSVGLVGVVMLLSYLLMPITALANDKAFCSDNDVSRTEKTIEKTETREEKEITLTAKKGELVKEKVDYELLIDASGSMKAERTDENNQKVLSIVEIKKAIRGFLDGLDAENDRVGVSVFRGPGYNTADDTILYDKSVTSLTDYTSDFDEVMERVEAIEAGGLTPLLDGMDHSLTKIKSASREEARKVLIIFTDGHPNIGPEREYVVVGPTVYGAGEEHSNLPGVHYPGSREIIDALREKSEELMMEDNFEEADKIDNEQREIESNYPLGAKLPISKSKINERLKGQLYENHIQEFYDLMYLIDGKANEIKQNNIEIFTIFLDNTDSDVNYKKVSANGEVEALFGRIAQDDAHYIRTADAKGLQSNFVEVSDNVKRYNFNLCDTVEDGFELVPNSFKFSNKETTVTENEGTLVWETKATAEKEMTVSYRIVRLKGKVIVHHVDTEGKELSANVELNGEVETSFTTEKAEIKDYTLTEVPVNATGTFTEEVQEVTYVYTKDVPTPKEGKVIVHYVDTEGNVLAKIVELSGEVEAAYNTEAKEIPGYGLVTIPDNKTGVFTEKTQEVTYVYSKDEDTPLPGLKEGTVIVKYQDEEGNPLAEITTLTDKIETAYITEAKDIEGYTLKERPTNAQGVFTEEEQTVVYIYSQDVKVLPDPIIETGTVIVHYVDTIGNTLSEVETLSGNIEASYETVLKEIPGYTFVNVIGNTTGAFTTEDQEVTYVYEKIEETMSPDKETQGTVTVVYEDGSGRLIEPSVVTKGDIGTEYHVTPKEIPGYVLKETKGNEDGTYTEENQTVTYVYEREVKKVSTTPSSIKGNSAQQLPKTGEEANAMYYIVGLGLLVVVAFVGMKKVRRHK